MIDLGDPVPLSVTTTDAAGAAANPTLIVLTITLPDGTTTTPTVTSSPVGTHTASYTTTQAGRHGVSWVATGAVLAAYADVFNVEPLAWPGIVSLADVKLRLNETTTTNDEELRGYIIAATDFIESKVGPVARRTITATVTPSSDGVIFLNGPFLSVTSITATRGYTTSYDVSTVFPDLAAGVIYPPLGSTFTYPVIVVYVGGRAIVPPLIRKAALDYIAWLWEDQRGASALPIAGGDFTVPAPATVPHKILQSLEPFTFAGFA